MQIGMACSDKTSHFLRTCYYRERTSSLYWLLKVILKDQE